MFSEWSALTQIYEGWSLTEIKELSKRERQNWLEVAKTGYGRNASG
jgi:hypothetical protein